MLSPHRISCSPIDCQSGGVGFTMQHLHYFCGSAVSPIDCQLGGVVFTTQHLHCFCGSAVRPLTGQSDTKFLPRSASIVSVDQLFAYRLSVGISFFAYWLPLGRRTFYHARPPLFLWIRCSPSDWPVRDVVFTRPLIYGSTDRWLLLFFQHLNTWKPYRPVLCKGSVHKFTNNN